jgi:peptidoglycan hydrolase-like protein with peptidoglycan-binding domain
MKIVITETQTKRLISLIESMTIEDYKNDLQKIIDSGKTYFKGGVNIRFNEETKTIQSGLEKLGYKFNKFGVDGKYGNETRDVVKKFQEDENLEVTGKMSTEDIEKLKELIDKEFKGEIENKEKSNKKESNTEKTTKQINKNSYIINLNNPNSKKITLIWGGMPSENYGAKFMEKIGREFFKNKNVIYSNYQNSILGVKKILEDNNLGDYKINSVSGFSRGGSEAWKEINGNYDFVGLIDPSTSKVYSNLPNNVKVISNSNNWTGRYAGIGRLLRQMEKNGDAEKVSTSHLEIPKLFFEKYSNQM